MKRKKLDEAADLLRERAGGTLDAAIVLGSGFGGVLRDRIDATPLAYKKIAGMPEPTVPRTRRRSARRDNCTAAASLHSAAVFISTKATIRSTWCIRSQVAAHAGAKTIVLTNRSGRRELGV